MKLFQVLLVTTGLILCSTGTNAQIYFKNNHKESVYLAVARYVNNGTSGYWMTQGWWTVIKGSTLKIFERIGPNDSIGYWCIARISETEYGGNRNLLVHNDEKFLIKNADQESLLQQHPNYEWRKFRMVRLKPGTQTGTIQFQ